MKFLLFNAAVVAAIVYLLAVDGDKLPMNQTKIPDQVEWQKKFDRINDRVAELKANADAAEDITEASPPEAKQKIDPQPTPKKAPPLLAEREVKVPIVNLPPQSKPASKAEAIKEAKKADPKFMTPRQRRRELNRLAHDMEMMFADKLAQ